MVNPLLVELHEQLSTAPSISGLEQLAHAHDEAVALRDRMVSALGEWPNFAPISAAEFGLRRDCLISRAAVSFVLADLGLYVLPTVELVAFLTARVPDAASCLEICAGAGWLARHLGWKACDSHAHRSPVVRARATLAGAPDPKTPPADVVRMDALACAERYKSESVVGLYVTHQWDFGSRTGSALGVDDRAIFRLPHVRRYVLVGNLETHRDRPLMRKPHETHVLPPGLWTRGPEPRIWIWTK